MNLLERNGSAGAWQKCPEEENDTLLVLAARSGDAIAFVELSRRHSKRTLLMLYRITRNWQDAEDMLQESLMKAFLHLDAFEGKASFSTWFTRIAINSALMLLRRRRGVLEIAIDGTDNPGIDVKVDLTDSGDDPEQCYARQQREAMMKLAVSQLPAGLRAVIELEHAGDLSNKEIARCLGISESAVKSRLLRARIAIRKSVQEKAGYKRPWRSERKPVHWSESRTADRCEDVAA